MNPSSDRTCASSGAIEDAAATSSPAPRVSPVPKRMRARLTRARTSAGSRAMARSSSWRAPSRSNAACAASLAATSAPTDSGMRSQRFLGGFGGFGAPVGDEVDRRTQDERLHRARLNGQRPIRSPCAPTRPGPRQAPATPAPPATPPRPRVRAIGRRAAAAPRGLRRCAPARVRARASPIRRQGSSAGRVESKLRAAVASPERRRSKLARAGPGSAAGRSPAATRTG